MEKIRLQELDLLRGLSVIGMILVVTPGAWGAGYSWLNHADWEGLVAVDLIAPAFMFCVGFAIPLALKARIESGLSSVTISRQIVQRGLLLILLGLFINWTGNPDFSTLRIPGVLQRIGLTYIAISLLILWTSRKSGHRFQPNLIQLSAIAAGFIVVPWLFFYWVPVPGVNNGPFSSDASWASFIDQAVFGTQHMWEWGQTNGKVTYDPDGLICSLSTCGNVLIGAILGVMYQQNSPFYSKSKLLILGVLLIALGFAFSTVCPIIKKIWTGSYVLISSGFSIIAFVFFWTTKELSLVNRLYHPFYAYGANALFAFAISWLGLFWYLNVPILNGQDLRSTGFGLLNSVIPSTPLASLAFGISFILILYALLAWMHKKRWWIKL